MDRLRNTDRDNTGSIKMTLPVPLPRVLCLLIARAGNSLIWFLSESLVFCPKMSVSLKKMSNSLIFSERNERCAHIAHFLWEIWVNHSQSLVSSEWPEQLAHGRSFVLSDLSESLTVTHLIWANERWANSQPCLPLDYCMLQKSSTYALIVRN